MLKTWAILWIMFWGLPMRQFHAEVPGQQSTGFPRARFNE